MANIDATSPQLQVVKDAMEAYTTLDLNNLAPYLSKDFTFETFPKIADLPENTKGGHIETYGALFRAFAKAEPYFHEVIDAPGKVVFQATGTFTTVEGTTHEYDSVCILSFVEEDGRLKIRSIKDFADPQKRDAIHAIAAKALAKAVA